MAATIEFLEGVVYDVCAQITALLPTYDINIHHVNSIKQSFNDPWYVIVVFTKTLKA